MSRPGSRSKTRRKGPNVSPSSQASADLQPCHTCGRTFLPDVLTRHIPICAKVFNSKRRVFESGRQRIAGTGVSITKIVKPGQVKKQGIKKTNWRQNHADFVNAIRSARQAQHAMQTGKPLPPPPPPSINPDYIQCPHCGRRFNQTAAARHINFCGERTNTFGAPVKPLNKRAAADVKGSRVAIRKAYDNIIVRRKPSTNPFAYAQGDGSNEDVKVYSAAFGGSGPDQQASAVTSRRNSTSPRRKIASPRQSYRSSSSQASSSPRQQPSPRQQAFSGQRNPPRLKQLSREPSSLMSHPSSSPRFQSPSQPSASLLPQTASMQHSSLRSLPPATQQHPSWQQPSLRKLPSPPQELTTLQPLSPSSPHQQSFSSSQSASSQSAPISQMSPPPLPQPSLNSLPPWQQALKASSGRSPPKATRLPNGHIRRSRLIKSGKPKGSVRFADNVQVKTFGDTLPGPDDSGAPFDFGAPSQSLYASDNAMPNSLDEQLLSRHQDLMSVLKKNYGDDVMLATPGNHIEEMMQSRHPVHPFNYSSLGEMGFYGNQGGHHGGGIPDLTPQSTGLQRSSALNGPSHLPPASIRTSYQDSYGRNGLQSFESTTPLALGNPSGPSHQPTSTLSGPPQGYGGRPRPIGGSLRGPVSTKPSSSDFSKLSISGSMHGGGLPGM